MRNPAVGRRSGRHPGRAQGGGARKEGARSGIIKRVYLRCADGRIEHAFARCDDKKNIHGRPHAFISIAESPVLVDTSGLLHLDRKRYIRSMRQGSRPVIWNGYALHSIHRNDRGVFGGCADLAKNSPLWECYDDSFINAGAHGVISMRGGTKERDRGTDLILDCRDPATGKPIWSTLVGYAEGRDYVSCAIGDGRLFCSTRHRRYEISCLDLASGAIRWQHRTDPNHVALSLYTTPGLVWSLVQCIKSRAHCCVVRKAETGVEVARIPKIASNMAFIDDRIVVPIGRSIVCLKGR